MKEPLYPSGTRIATPLGIGCVRSYRASRHQPGVTLVEVQLDHDSCIRTWTEDELALTGGMPLHRPAPAQLLRRHYVPGEAVSTLDGEGIIRNLMRDAATGAYQALVQLVGTNRSITVPCTDLSPPLEAA